MLKNIKNLLREYRHCLRGNKTQINKTFPLKYFQLREISPSNYVALGLRFDTCVSLTKRVLATVKGFIIALHIRSALKVLMFERTHRNQFILPTAFLYVFMKVFN